MDEPQGILPPEQLTNCILESITEGLFTVDRERTILSFNSAAQRITGVSRSQAVGRKCWEVFRASVCGNCPLLRSMESLLPSGEMEVEITTAHRGVIPVRIRPSVLRDSNGRVVGGVETFTDLSEVVSLRKRLKASYGFCDLKGKSPQMCQIFELLPRVAASGATVLITGESGTGKELVARAIHDLSPRSDGPFVALNCGAIPPALVESELFGAVRGAYTGAERDRQGVLAAAEGGSLLLDEVGELPMEVQVKLLRLLDSGEYTPLGSAKPRRADVRIIAATNRDLAEEVDKGRFRADLYYRLNVLHIHIPPLRERPQDIPVLVEHFLEELAAELGQPVRSLSPAAMGLVMDYPWPGNARQLRNALEHALVLADQGPIHPRHLPEAIRRRALGPRVVGDELNLKRLEREAIVRALSATGGHRGRAARMLGISPATLWRKMKAYSISK